MYANRRPKIIAMMIGFRMKNVRTRIAAMNIIAIPRFMSSWSVMVVYGFGGYK